MRTCNKCKQDLPDEEFFVGEHRCRACCKIKAQKYRAAHRSEIAARHRKYSAAHRAEESAHKRKYRAAHRADCMQWYRQYYRAHPTRSRAYVQRWQESHPEAIQAHSKVHAALKTGELVKSPFCQLCLTSNYALDLHHYNGYENWMDVLTVCRPCHKDLHAIGKDRRAA